MAALALPMVEVGADQVNPVTVTLQKRNKHVFMS